MVIAIATFIGLASLLFIWYPFVRKSQERGFRPVGEKEQNLLELEGHRDATYAVIKELEFDYQMGKLSQEDYQNLRGKYEQTALGILAKIDSLKYHRPLVRSRPEGAGCPECDSPLKPGDKFCPQCGFKLPLFCANCGVALSQEFRFCPSCGQAAPIMGKS